MATVHEILLQSGFSPSQIAQLDANAVAAFSNVLSIAQQERQAAELAGRANTEFYETRIVPALTSWEAEQQQLEAAKARAEQQAAFYRQAAIAAGLVSGDEQARDGQGRYIAGSGTGTPGSPTFIDPQEVVKRASDGLAILSDIQWRHQNLYGAPLPLSPSKLVGEADAAGLDPATYANRKFKFSEREQELERKRQQAHDDQIRHDAVAERDKFWSEKSGSNPDVRQSPGSSKYGEVRRAVAEGKAPDPLKLTDQQRRSATRQAIHKEIEQREEAS